MAIDNLVTGTIANIEHLFGERGIAFVQADVAYFESVFGLS